MLILKTSGSGELFRIYTFNSFITQNYTVSWQQSWPRQFDFQETKRTLDKKFPDISQIRPKTSTTNILHPVMSVPCFFHISSNTSNTASFQMLTHQNPNLRCLLLHLNQGFNISDFKAWSMTYLPCKHINNQILFYSSTAVVQYNSFISLLPSCPAIHILYISVNQR